MKHLVILIKQILTVSCLVFWVAGFFGFFIPAQAISDNSVADEIISLNVTDRPLGDVLKMISIAADCQFIIDTSWENYPITAIFDEEPLYEGLKIIFWNINNAVVYGTNRTIRIIIYDEGTSSDRTIGHPFSIKSAQEPIRQPPTLGEATASQSELELSETGSHMEDVEQLPETTADSGSEENESDEENTDAHDEEPDEAASEGTAATIGPVKKESDSDDESNQTEETESSSGGLENSEITENNEESSEN